MRPEYAIVEILWPLIIAAQSAPAVLKAKGQSFPSLMRHAESLRVVKRLSTNFGAGSKSCHCGTASLSTFMVPFLGSVAVQF